MYVRMVVVTPIHGNQRQLTANCDVRRIMNSRPLPFTFSRKLRGRHSDIRIMSTVIPCRLLHFIARVRNYGLRTLMHPPRNKHSQTRGSRRSTAPLLLLPGRGHSSCRCFICYLSSHSKHAVLDLCHAIVTTNTQ